MPTTVSVENRDAGWFVVVLQDEEIVEELGPFDRQKQADDLASEKIKTLGLL